MMLSESRIIISMLLLNIFIKLQDGLLIIFQFRS